MPKTKMRPARGATCGRERAARSAAAATALCAVRAARSGASARHSSGERARGAMMRDDSEPLRQRRCGARVRRVASSGRAPRRAELTHARTHARTTQERAGGSFGGEEEGDGLCGCALLSSHLCTCACQAGAERSQAWRALSTGTRARRVVSMDVVSFHGAEADGSNEASSGGRRRRWRSSCACQQRRAQHRRHGVRQRIRSHRGGSGVAASCDLR